MGQEMIVAKILGWGMVLAIAAMLLGAVGSRDGNSPEAVEEFFLRSFAAFLLISVLATGIYLIRI